MPRPSWSSKGHRVFVGVIYDGEDVTTVVAEHPKRLGQVILNALRTDIEEIAEWDGHGTLRLETDEITGDPIQIWLTGTTIWE